jgi:hypothetical protein
VVSLLRNESDDAEFIALAERVINAEASLVAAELLHLVRIDSWFGPNWYSFAGKAIGAVAVYSPPPRFRVPPFHPHRVVSEERYRRDDPPVPVTIDQPLHGYRSSEENLHHWFGWFGRAGAFGTAAWYSGQSASSGRGSIMVYSSTPHGRTGWYAGFERRPRWDLIESVDIDPRHWLALQAG